MRIDRERRVHMGRKGINRILWTALGIHILYFVLLGIIAANQQRIIGMLSSIQEPPLFSAPALLAGASVFLAAHVVLTALLVRRPPAGGGSTAGEWAGLLLFGAVFPIFSIFGSWIAMLMVGRLIGVYGLASYSLLRRMFWLAGPIRTIAISLFLLAAGMSVYEKQAGRNGFFTRPGKVGALLWWSMGLDGAFFLIMMLIILFQNPIKAIYGTPEVLFVWPVSYILSAGALLAAHLALTLCLVQQAKTRRREIVWEILGALLFSGVLEWAGIYLNWVTSILLARRGKDILSNYSSLTNIIGAFGPVHTLGISLFIAGCGLLIARKNSGSAPGGEF